MKLRAVGLLLVLVLPACGGGGGGGGPAGSMNPHAIGAVTAIFPHTLPDMGTKEMAIGDLVADALRFRYGVQIGFQNGWGCRSTLPAAGVLPSDLTLRRPDAGYAAGPPYDLTTQDITTLLPFGNTVVTRTVTGTQLWAVFEEGFRYYAVNNNGFPQISGVTVTFDSAGAPGSRVTSIVLEGGGAIAKDATTYTFATNDFINAGGDNYTMLNDGQGTVREILADVVADHIRGLGVISPTVAGRIIIN